MNVFVELLSVVCVQCQCEVVQVLMVVLLMYCLLYCDEDMVLYECDGLFVYCWLLFVVVLFEMEL